MTHWSDLPPQVQAAVLAYDQARRGAYEKLYGSIEPEMSEANRVHIAPMIMAACYAYIAVSAHLLVGEDSRPT